MFASDTKHVSLPSTHNASWLRPLPKYINKFIRVDCFAASTDLPACHKELQSATSWRYSLYLTPQETTLPLSICCDFFLKWGHYMVEKHARVVCFPQTGHLAVRKGKPLSQASAEMHWLALCWLVDLKHSQQKPDCNYTCSCSLCIYQVQQGSRDVLFSIKTQQGLRVPLSHALVGKETHLTWLSCLQAKSNIARLMIGA